MQRNHQLERKTMPSDTLAKGIKRIIARPIDASNHLESHFTTSTAASVAPEARCVGMVSAVGQHTVLLTS